MKNSNNNNNNTENTDNTNNNNRNSTRTTMATSRWTLSRTLGLTALLACLLLHLAPSALASPDYADGDVGGEVIDSNNNNNDEIYDPAQLQQEVETSEHNNNHIHSQDMEAGTDYPPEDARNVSTNQISTEELGSQELENATREHRNASSEEYGGEVDDDNEMESEDGEAQEERQMRERMPGATEASTNFPTTMIPEYVRKAMAKQARPEAEATMASTASEEAAPAADNASMSDYMEDEEDEEKAEEDGGGEEATDHSVDEIVPLAMKFYQTPEDSDNDGDNNKQQVSVPLPQQQLPEARSFYNHSEEGGEADDDDDELSVEQLIKHQHQPQHRPATSAPPTAAATAPTPPTYRPIDVLRASIPGFPLGFGGSRTTTTRAPATEAAVTEGVAGTAGDNNMMAMTTRPPHGLATTTTTTTTTVATTMATTTAAAAIITTTTGRPAGNKQGKQINIASRRKLLPHEQLRNYIEDAYIRMPLAVIVDPSAESLEKTKALWRDALRTNFNIKIVLVSLNASGIPAAYSFNNTRQFLAGMNSIKEHNGGDAFTGIVHASELVPYDSAVFISTAAIPPHTELVQDAAITLLKKRIRLYLIWYGERSVSENETQEAVGGILGEVAIRSGGEILHIVGSENSQELEGNTLTLVADAFHGSQEVDVPVDTTLSSLHVKIDSPMRTATLETPYGDINLKKLVKFRSRIMTKGRNDKRLDAYVPLTKLRKSTVFKLKMIPESEEIEYSVFVRADRKADLFLEDMIKRFDSYFLDGVSAYPTKFRDSRLSSITAALAAATIPTHDNIRFPENENEIDDDDDTDNVAESPKSEVETFSETEINKTINTTAIVDNSRSVYGNQRESNILQQGVTKIEMGTQSQVLVAPGMMAQLYFEVTNTRTEAVYHNIQVIDERKFLQRLSPQSIFLPAGATTSVTVTVLVPTTAAQGTIDKITFTCHGSPTVSLSLNLKVITTQDAEDSTPPDVSWTYSSRCDNVDSDVSSCSERYWILDVKAQDWQTGILRLQSSPTGLIYRNTYTVGSTEPLKATYIATCCQPKVALVAYDIAGNQRSYTIDARDFVLTEASIAAIVLGVLLLILLIVLLVALIVWCYRRRKVTLDLPTYRSHSTRSME